MKKLILGTSILLLSAANAIAAEQEMTLPHSMQMQAQAEQQMPSTASLRMSQREPILVAPATPEPQQNHSSSNLMKISFGI